MNITSFSCVCVCVCVCACVHACVYIIKSKIIISIADIFIIMILFC